MKKLFIVFSLAVALVAPTAVMASEIKGVNVIVNSSDPQTQAMAMVLSLMSMKKHGKEVNIVLCSGAGDLADKNIKGTPIKRPNGKAPSAKDHLKKLIKAGANVQVCPLYLPNANKDASVLLEGVSVAKPPRVAKFLVDPSYQNMSF